MKDKDKQILKKITKYINEALEYTANMNFETFSADNKTISATAFALGQIGELTIHISDELKSKCHHIFWKGIRGLRNRIVHNYESIDLKMMWDIISNDLPILSIQIKELENNMD